MAQGAYSRGRLSAVASTAIALVTTSVPVLSLASPAAAVTLPGDVGGHEHVTGLLDVSQHQCGQLLRGAEDSGYMTSPSSYSYIMPSPKGTASANAIDHHFIQDSNGGGIDNALVWELPTETATVDMFPSIDHGPVPGEALEATVYGFDDPAAPSSTWEVGDISTIFDNGWSDWISDDFVSRWDFTHPHKYYAARWGGPKALVADGDVELDALCAPQLTPTGLEAGPDQTVHEGDLVTLSAKLVGGSATRGTYEWKLVGATGAPITLSSPGNATTTFRPLDDGLYKFSVEATAAGETFTDEVSVKVLNAKPVIATDAKPTADDKLAMVTTTLTDSGPLDTHTATYDWGDGSPAQTFPVMQGSGWGYAHAGHIYDDLGTYTVTVKVSDDDGGESETSRTVVDVGGAGPAAPRIVPSLWAASETTKYAVDLTGDGTVADGLVHSNNDVRVAGNGKKLTGGVEYAAKVTLTGSGHVIDPEAVKADVAPYPVEWVLEDYRPGGVAQERLGAAYVDDSAHCGPSGWQPESPLSDGVHWVPCDVRIRDGVLDGGKVTVVATGSIDVASQDDTVDAYDDGLQFLSGSGSKKAIKVAGSGSTFAGSMFAASGGIEVSGSEHEFTCGLLGQNVSISGTGNTISTGECEYDTDQSSTIPVAAPPVLVPNLRASLAAAPESLAPGGQLRYDGALTNGAPTLAVPVLFGVSGLSDSAATVTELQAVVEYFDENQQKWLSLGSTEDGNLVLEQRAIDADGVQYARGAVVGTTLDGRALAAWGAVASLEIAPEQLGTLLDPAVVSAVRARVELTTSGGRARSFSRSADNLIDTIRRDAGVVRDARVALTPSVGSSTVLTSSGNSALDLLRPGDAVAFDTKATLPAPSPRGEDETSSAYLARLAQLDGRTLVGSVYASGNAAIGPVLAPQQVARARERVGLVHVDLVTAETSTAGKQAAFDVRLRNDGTAAAQGLSVDLTVDGLGAVPLNDLPDTLAPGEQVTAHASAALPDAGTVEAQAKATWTSPGSDERFGPTDDTVEIRVIAETDHPLTLGSVSGRFFHSAADATAFTATPADTPVFAQSFPNIAFNPPAGTLEGDPGADPSTRPFTDVLVGPDAKPAGTLQAASKDKAAGVDELESFQAVFSGELEVTEPGVLELSVISDDGFTLGVENATRVSGPNVGAPTQTPFENLPVMAAENTAGSLATYPVKIDFPAAGRYRFELDYFTRAGDSMSLVLTHPGTPGDSGGGRVFLTGHDPDFHAVIGGNATGARHIIQRAVGYVTGDRPSPQLLLVTDLRNPGGGYSDPRLGMKAAGFFSFDVADYGSGTAGVLDLHKVDFGDYDAVVVASDFGGWLRQDELDVLNARADEIRSYLRGGGGLVAFAEGSSSSALTQHDRFGFIGCPSAGLDQNESGFKITAQGIALGLNQTDLNGNASHMMFPGTCGLDVLDTDLSGRIMSLATPGTVGGPTRVVPPSNYLLLSPLEPSAEVGSTISLTAQAMDAAGNARSGVPVTLDVTDGPDAGSYNAVTDASGAATFALKAVYAGDEYAFATALVAGDASVSNSVHVIWTTPTTDGGGGGDTSDTGDTQTGDGPLVSDFSPAEGAVVTEPTPVTLGSVTPAEGRTVEGWKLTVREQGASADTARTLASGTGAPPTQDTTTMTASIPSAVTGTDVLATFDPTTLPNGIWILQLVLVDSAGGHTRTQVAVVVDGQLKLGDAELAYLDVSIPVGGIPIQLQRRYRSIDRRRDGDLGHGWSLDAANFRVQVNRPLGAGGWEQYGCGSGLVFVPLCYRTSKPHFVTVTWPNGRTETFDFTPGPGNTFFSMAVPPGYTGRRGTTSKLEPAPDDLGASWLGDGNLYGGAFGGDGLYDPQRFVLVAADGTRYLLDRSSGLVQATDRTGNTVTVSQDGIRSSAGPRVSYHRDPEGRIDRIDGPAGLTVSYEYDANGDLISVTDGNGHVHRYGYQDHLLTTNDEPGAGPFQTLKYEGGRLVSVDDGVNPPQTFDVSLGARTETTVSPDLKETVVTTFDERGNPIEVDRVFDGEHHKTTYEYNDFDFVTLRQDPTGRTWQAQYDDEGHLSWLKDARGKTTTFEEYTDFGVPRTIKDELGHATRLAFDPETADLLSVQDPLGHSRTWTYNPDGTVATYRDGSLKVDGTPREWSYTYEGGQVRTEKDPAGHVTTYEHNAAGQLTAEIDATGVRTEYEYDGVGNLWYVKLPLGRTTEYRYDERDRLTDVFDGERRNTHYRYNDVGLLWKEGRGNPDNGERDTLTYTYTPRDQVETILNSAGDQVKYEYDGGGRLASVEDGEHQVTEYGYDLADRVVSTKYPNGSTDTWGYDENGRLATIKDDLGGETVLGRDDTGRVTSVADPMQHKTTYEYDDAGHLRFVKDALNHATEYQYDEAGRLAAEINALGEKTQYTYGAAGRLSSVQDGEGRQTDYGYDDAGRPNRVTDALGRAATTTYDEGGWPRVHATAAGVTSTLAWDRAGLLKSVTDELDHTTSWDYDPVGRLAQRVNARGFATTWKYDPAGRVQREIDAKDGSVEFGYDHAGQLTSLTDPRGKVSRIGYDPLGNVDEFINPLGKTWSWTYDELGRLDLSTDPKNQQVDWDYDPASRPDKTTTPAGVTDYTYDDADRLTSVVDPTGTVSWAYDDADRPKLVTAPAGDVGYQYDGSGLLTAMQLPQGTVTRSYDAAGELDRVTDWTGAWTDYDVNGDGQPERVTRSNGVTTDYSYDDVGRLDHLSHTGSTGAITGFDYELDENGNRVAETSPSGTVSYTLDELDRLTKAVYPSGKTVDYTYNADGSRKTRTIDQKTTEYTYDDAGELVSAVGPDRTTDYTYDPNGNLKTAGGDRYGYDWADRMVSANVDGVDHSWTYDGQGMRVEADGVPQLWDRTVDNPAGVEHLVGAGDTAFEHHPFGGLSSSIQNGSTTWALDDALGSTRALTDGSGAVAGTASYDAFGAVRDRTGAESVFGFAGEQTDPGGLLYLRARTLNTETGQFMQPDSVIPGAPGTIGFNRYAYAGNNPTMWIDPTGHNAAGEYGGLLSGVSSRIALTTRVLGQCAYGALTESAMGLAISAIAGGVTVGGVAFDAVTGCFTRGAEGVPRVRLPDSPVPGGPSSLPGSSFGPARLKPYGGPGGGHHVPAKSAFGGAPNYDPKRALAIPNDEMKALNVSHPRITGAQRSGYTAFAKTGKALGWDDVARIEQAALEKGGMSAAKARATVQEAIQALKDAGVTGPTKIPWN